VFPSSSSFFEKMFSENNFEYFLYFELFINVLFWKEKTKGKKKKKIIKESYLIVVLHLTSSRHLR
jgi:hypothetical protein